MQVGHLSRTRLFGAMCDRDKRCLRMVAEPSVQGHGDVTCLQAMNDEPTGSGKLQTSSSGLPVLYPLPWMRQPAMAHGDGAFEFLGHCDQFSSLMLLGAHGYQAMLRS